MDATLLFQSHSEELRLPRGAHFSICAQGLRLDTSTAAMQTTSKLLLLTTACCALSASTTQATSSATDTQVPQTGGANSTNPSSSSSSNSNVSTIVVTLMPVNVTFTPASSSSGSTGQLVDAPLARSVPPSSSSPARIVPSQMVTLACIATWLGSYATAL